MKRYDKDYDSMIEQPEGEWVRYDEVERMAQLNEYYSKTLERLQDGRDYLMSVNPNEITVEDCLVAFGWNRCGLKDGE